MYPFKGLIRAVVISGSYCLLVRPLRMGGPSLCCMARGCVLSPRALLMPKGVTFR